MNIQPFYSLSLDVAAPGIYSVQHAIDAYMQASRIEGYRGSQSYSKSHTATATQRHSIEALPNILILHLKRFDVVAQDDFNRDQYFAHKLNKHIRFDSDFT